MFKGIVMEVKDNYAIVMKVDGTMVRVKIKGELKVGDSLFFLEEDIYEKVIKTNKINLNRLIVPLGLVAAMILVVLSPVFKNLNPSINNSYALITFDVNPSVELNLDSSGKIITAKGLNDDGSALNLKSIEGLNINDGIAVLKQLFSDGNYLINNNSVLVGFSFTSATEDMDFEKNVQNIVKKAFDTSNVAYLKGTDDDIKIAESLGISLGKYEAELELDDDLLEEAIEDLSVEQILELLRSKPDVIFWDEDIIDELEDELEDKLEDQNEDDNEEDDEEDKDDDGESDDDKDDDED